MKNVHNLFTIDLHILTNLSVIPSRNAKIIPQIIMREVFTMKHKRIITALTSLLMAASMSAGCLTAAAEDDVPRSGESYSERELGDCNGDNMFGIADVVTLNNYLLGKEDSIIFEQADINCDGNVNMFDLILLRRKFVDKAPLPQIYPVEDLCAGIGAGKVTGIEADEEFILAQTGFGLEFLKRLDLDENTLISPYSITEALAMTANGAKGQTLKEMEDTMGGISIDKLNEYLYTQRISQPNEEKCKLFTANSIWARDDEKRIKVNKDFLKTDMDYYDAEFYVADDDDPKTVDAINGWVRRHTDNMIDKVIDSETMNTDAVMDLINAVTFDAKWEYQYQPNDVTNYYKFTAADGNKQDAQMLCSTEYNYLKDDNAEGILKYYEGGRYAFAALLPDEGTSLSDYVSGLTAEKLNSVLSSVQNEPVISRIPKFKYKYSRQLGEDLVDMGMPTAFGMGDVIPDFTGMNDADNVIFIGSVLHKTFIQLDEEGTKAAAVTVVEMEDGVAPLPEKEITFDRPFLYCIVDTETNIPVFIGTLVSLV